MHVEVSTGARLHFGLFARASETGRSFGGVGAMIDAPRLQLQAAMADEWRVSGPLAERAAKTAREIEIRFQQAGHAALPGVRLEIEAAPREHVGLGVGTQISLAIAAALLKLRGVNLEDASQLAMLAGRGARSAVGTHGFLHGGLIVDAGKSASDGYLMGALAERIELPASWRVVLIIPTQGAGLAGDTERRAFAELGPIEPGLSAELHDLADEELLPAARAADFAVFSEAVYQFNHRAGLCFATWQHEAYASPQTAALVSLLRSWGIAGVGQSSWGPSLFAWLPDQAAAEHLRQRLSGPLPAAEYEVNIAKPLNRGATVRIFG